MLKRISGLAGVVALSLLVFPFLFPVEAVTLELPLVKLETKNTSFSSSLNLAAFTTFPKLITPSAATPTPTPTAAQPESTTTPSLEMPAEPITFTADQYKAEYFDTPDMTGTPVIIRPDWIVAYEWGEGSPSYDELPENDFSVRWTKKASFEEGNYRFRITVDGGFRLFIDNVNVLDRWYDTADTYTLNQSLTHGDHEIKIEYFKHTGLATIYLFWEKAEALPSSTFLGRYFPNKSLSGLPALIREDTSIDFDWGTTPIAPSLPSTEFSVQWSKTQQFSGGTYQFNINADDGIRLFIDGIPYINQWKDESSQQHSANVVIPGGEHSITLEYYQNGGDARVKLDWKRVGDAPSSTFQAEYFNTATLSGTPIFTASYPTIAFDWKELSPNSAVPIDGFSARFIKTENFAGGEYRFIVTADDGVRIFLDEQLIVDKWKEHAPTTYTLFIPITSGTHTIKIEYYENNGGAMMKAQWDRIRAPSAEMFEASYYANATFTGKPKFTRKDTTIDYNWGAAAPDSSLPIDAFSVRWVKTEQFVGGQYRFTITADDGLRIFIDDVLILNQWKKQSSSTYTTEIPIASGDHTVKIEYYEHSGDAVAKVHWNSL